MIPFFVFIFCLVFVLGAYLLATRGSEKRRARLQERLAEALMTSAHSGDSEIRLAREELMSEIPFVNRVMLQLGFASRLKRLIEQADLNITVTRLMMFSMLAGILGALAVSVLTPAWVLSLLAGAVAASLPFLHVVWKRHQRLRAFLMLLPDALDLMSRALQAGHAFPEALHMVSTEMPEPIATEFRKTYEEQNLGLSLKLALENLSTRIPLLDLRLCITAIMIQRETGGNLAEVLEKVAYTIRERFRILEDLRTLTTSSRMSAWILCGLPLFLALAVTFIHPDYMIFLWYFTRSHELRAVASALQITGMLGI